MGAPNSSTGEMETAEGHVTLARQPVLAGEAQMPMRETFSKRKDRLKNDDTLKVVLWALVCVCVCGVDVYQNTHEHTHIHTLANKQT